MYFLPYICNIEKDDDIDANMLLLLFFVAIPQL